PINQWFLSSVPQGNNRWPEGNLINDLAYGANRGRMNWYRIDLSARNTGDTNNPYTSLVDQNEVFPNVQVTPDQLPNIQTFDLSFYPQERGPYNFDLPGGRMFSRGVTFQGDSLILNDPRSRWGGVMRSLNTVDFQTANIEYLEFWMLSPFLDPTNPQNGILPQEVLDSLEGNLYFHFGNISEDILRDSRKFFENGLPSPFNPNRQVDTTAWGIVPVAQQITRFFDNDRQGGSESRKRQDVGLDGLDDDGEKAHFSEYIEAIRAVNPAVAAKIELDPSNDNFRYFSDPSFGPNDGILRRYRDFNNPQGNSPENTGQLGLNSFASSTNIPDAEDINQDNTVNETEAYFQYRVPIKYDRGNPREIDTEATPFITDTRLAANGRIWYRFRVPLNSLGQNEYTEAFGGIRDFRSIRFMRMMLKDFGRPVTLRFATIELVRNQWRRYQQDLSPSTNCNNLTFNIDAVNIEENISRLPFNYVLPAGIVRERSLGVFNALQNEQSLVLQGQNLCDGEEVAVFKTINLDMRMYKKLQMFVHAEDKQEPRVIQPGDLSIFI
ncbi:MAG TPA: cell surface protein SprA, partial [Saprospiraceae bacterium]|nr:cell surface protein SprA [Saprospiraceae bacterium]